MSLDQDGKLLLYETTQDKVSQNSRDVSYFVCDLASGKVPKEISLPSGSENLAWIPHTRRIAFLAQVGMHQRLFSYDLDTRSVGEISNIPGDITSFRISPDGRYTALVVLRPVTTEELPANRTDVSTSAVVVDPKTTSIQDFVNPNWGRQKKSAGFTPVDAELWIDGKTKSLRIAVPGEPTGEMHWKSNSGKLSVQFVAADVAPGIRRSSQTSIGIYTISGETFHTLAKGDAENQAIPTEGFDGASWIRSSDNVLLIRRSQGDIWVSPSYPQWLEISERDSPQRRHVGWISTDTYEGGQYYPLQILTECRQKYIETTRDARHSLYVLEPDKKQEVTSLQRWGGSNSQFTFDRGCRLGAFVHDSLNEPPEIYLLRRGHVRRLTFINTDVSVLERRQISAISWKSSDSERVHGWLIEPLNVSRPYPLVTLIHGGPTFAFTDSFAPYFLLWPYPIEALVSHGIGVFIPNYRGTGSFGRSFETPPQPYTTAIADISTGLDELVSSGIADRSRLGIAGHSHGADLGALTMEKLRSFRASSFAEGAAGSKFLMYELMSGELNELVHDQKFGGSLYDVADDANLLSFYIESSPNLHFRGLTTATLFEAGSLSFPMIMLSAAKAAMRARMPTEFVVYPNSGHNLDAPALMLESAQLNLDWFSFWLLGIEEGEPERTQQYFRWRTMRSTQDSYNTLN